MEHKKNKMSRWGFILSAVGSAVGMANVWGFPAKMGAYGGSAFLIAYLFFVALFSFVGLSAEYAIGRRSRTGTLGSYEKAWATRSKAMGRAGGTLGWLPLTGSMCIAIGYAVIVSYVLKAFYHSMTGELMHVDTTAWFESFSTTHFSVVPFHIIVVVAPSSRVSRVTTTTMTWKGTTEKWVVEKDSNHAVVSTCMSSPVME